jgi:hypothetical protein
MTQTQKDNYQKAYERDNWQCQIEGCPKRATQQGHRIGNTVLNRKMYGDYIIDHPVNTVSVCDTKDHNRMVDVSSKTNESGVLEVIEEIKVYDLEH